MNEAEFYRTSAEQTQCYYHTEFSMRPCCSDVGSAMCYVSGGAFFIFFLLAILVLIYTLIYRKSLLSVLFEGNVILWLLTRAISLTFWHTANSAESRSSGYCFYILLKNIPAYFMTQAVLILIIQLWGDYRCIEACENENVIKSVEKKQRKLVLVLSIVNLVITGVCLSTWRFS